MYYWNLGLQEARTNKKFETLYHEVDSAIKDAFFSMENPRMDTIMDKIIDLDSPGARLRFIAMMQIISTWAMTFPGYFHKNKFGKVSETMRHTMKHEILTSVKREGEEIIEARDKLLLDEGRPSI